MICCVALKPALKNFFQTAIPLITPLPRALWTQMHVKLLQSVGFLVGSALGAGILALPVITSLGGYLPSVIWSLLVAAALGTTGHLLAKRAIELGDDVHLASLCRRFLGPIFAQVVLVMIAVHYGSLLVAYCSVGSSLIGECLRVQHYTSPHWGALSYLAIISFLCLLKPKSFLRTNLIMTALLVVIYIGIIATGWDLVEVSRLTTCQLSSSLWTLPIFYSAFGFHSVIPSMCRFCDYEPKLVKRALWLSVACIWLIVMFWQTLVMGSVDLADLRKVLDVGGPATAALSQFSRRPSISILSNLFAFLAIVTSHTGVVFALRDYGLDFFRSTRKNSSKGLFRATTAGLLFVPMMGALRFPHIFETALTFSGGIGSAFLNGLVPIFMSVHLGRGAFSASNLRLLALALLPLTVMGFEVGNLIAKRF